mmetsp:Transcript_8286/g.14039  ORF Transcript_8286/g.14039 Transcript_8286/m.14039 type:complete len:102 (+) Transcript_8286:366-671(+)
MHGAGRLVDAGNAGEYLTLQQETHQREPSKANTNPVVQKPTILIGDLRPLALTFLFIILPLALSFVTKSRQNCTVGECSLKYSSRPAKSTFNECARAKFAK